MSSPSQQPLRQIIEKVQAATQAKRKSLLVFDLDSTLFDVSPRIQRILYDFAVDPTFAKAFPESCEILKSVAIHTADWGIQDALVRAGLDQHHPDFHHAIRKFWRKHFFSNEYLEYDIPYDGALNYVQSLYKAGAEIVYLTGRDVPRMGPGTDKILQKWKFPLSPPRAISCLKPQQDIDDARFKSDYFAQLPRAQYEQIWLFENEPVNIHLIRDEHPHVEVIYFDSTHSNMARPPTDLPKIMHYLLD